MKSSAIFVAIFAATTMAMAAPPKPPKPSKPTPPQSQTINCGNNAAPYCCALDNSIGAFVCAVGASSCNSITVCCNNQAQTGGSANQNCGLGGPVIFI